MRTIGKKILILGGTGLIGTELVKKLALNNNVTVVSLGSRADKDSFSALELEFPKLKHITGNIFLPKEYKNRTFNELLDSDNFLEDYIRLLYSKPNHRSLFLYDVLKNTRPQIVIDSINSATVLSYTKNISLIRDYLNGKVVKLETLLATLSMPRLINYFDCVYKTFKELDTVETFVKIGTTGTGGMGFDIPYTHGEERPSHQLLEKAAVSGAYTSLLYLLSRTFGMPKVKEIKPGTLVGYKKVGFDKISLGRNSSQSLKVYRVGETNKIDLRKLKRLDFENFNSNGVKTPFRSVFVDTGENGQFSLEEFRTISNSRQMGFITKEEIAEVVLSELQNNETGKDIIRKISEAILGPTKLAQKVRNNVINEMESLESIKKTKSLAFEVLGPPRLSKLIFEAYLIEKNNNLDKRDFEKLTFGKRIEEDDLSLIVSTGIPILLPDKTLVFGKKPTIPSYENVLSNANIDSWAKDGWVDLRKKNLDSWKRRLRLYKKESGNINIGDIVAWIFENEDKGFRSQN
jgi:hypothetical protein